MLPPRITNRNVFFFPANENIDLVFFVIIKIRSTGTKPKILRATAKRVGL